jgi:hypothetical protein
MFSLEYAQLLTEGKDLQAEAVTGTEEGIEEGEEPMRNEIMVRIYSIGVRPDVRVNCLNLPPHGVLATHRRDSERTQLTETGS